MRLHELTKIFFSTIIGFCLVFYSVSIVYSETKETLNQKLVDIQNKKSEYQNRIDELQNESLSLHNRIEYMDKLLNLISTEIKEEELKISIKESELLKIKEDIKRLQSDILVSDSELRATSSFYNDSILNYYYTYKISEYYNGLNFITDIKIIKDLYYFAQTKPKVLEILQDHTLALSRLDKISISNIQRHSEINKLDAEISFHKDLISTRTSALNYQKQLRLDLLAYTKNSEKTYQNLLAKAQQEEQAIEDAISKYSDDIDSNQVKNNQFVLKGSIIGFQGSTGFSTGEHLHFSVYNKCGVKWCHKDPFEYLKNNTLAYPITNFKITQGYGITTFAKSIGFYKDHFHNGIDLVGPKSAEIKASADGYIKYVTDSYGAKGALIYHNDNLMSAYWHLR